MPDEPDAPGTQSRPEPSESLEVSRVIIRPLPKIVFLWPTTLAALLCFLLEAILGGDEPSSTYGLIFFAVMALNFPVVAFNFSRVTFVVLVLVVALVSVLQVWKPVFGFVEKLDIAATAQFYVWFFFLMLVIYVVVFIQTRFNYWELTHNELLHHHGILGDVERYPAPGLRITKEVDDVFEFFLLGAGRLVIQPPVEPRAIVLENVPLVNGVENRLKEVLSTLKVKVGPSS